MDHGREPARFPDWEDSVYCPRLGRLRKVSEHQKCLYCFGSTLDVVCGDHRCFCDFRRGADPVNFGFPPGRGREERG